MYDPIGSTGRLVAIIDNSASVIRINIILEAGRGFCCHSNCLDLRKSMNQLVETTTG